MLWSPGKGTCQAVCGRRVPDPLLIGGTGVWKLAITHFASQGLKGIQMKQVEEGPAPEIEGVEAQRGSALAESHTARPGVKTRF